MEKQIMAKEFFTLVNNTFDNGDGYITIDAWETNDDNEEGKVIAVVNKTTKEPYYIDSRARYSEMAQRAINEVINR